MATINPYINYDGNCEDAFVFLRVYLTESFITWGALKICLQKSQCPRQRLIK